MDEHKIFQLCARFTVWIAIRNSALQFPFFFAPERERERVRLAHSVLTEYIWIHFNMLRPSSALNSPGGWMCSAFRLEFIRLIACVCATRALALSLSARVCFCCFSLPGRLGEEFQALRACTPTARFYTCTHSRKWIVLLLGEQFIAVIN